MGCFVTSHRDRERALQEQIGGFLRAHGSNDSEEASLDDVCAIRAAKIYRAATEAVGGVRPAARLAKCDPKTVRDRRRCGRGLYFKDALKVGRVGLYALAQEIVDFANELPSEPPPSSRNGTHG